MGAKLRSVMVRVTPAAMLTVRSRLTSSMRPLKMVMILWLTSGTTGSAWNKRTLLNGAPGEATSCQPLSLLHDHVGCHQCQEVHLECGLCQVDQQDEEHHHQGQELDPSWFDSLLGC